jgi:sterol 14-demethylase
MKVKVDVDLCQGHSVCVDECPEVFKVVDRGGEYPQVVVLIEHPDESLRAKVQAAAKYCPNKVIRIED